MEKLITIRSYFHKHDAEVAKALLESEGIECILSSDDAGGFRPDLTFSMNNNRILITPDDVEKSNNVLKVLEQEADVDMDLMQEYERTISDAPKEVTAEDLKISENVMIQIFSALVVLIYIILFVIDRGYNFRHYDVIYKEPYSTIYYMLRTPVNVAMIFIGVNVFRRLEWARRAMISMFVLLVISTADYFVPDSRVMIHQADVLNEGPRLFQLIKYVILYSIPIVFLMNKSIKRRFKKTVAH